MTPAKKVLAILLAFKQLPLEFEIITTSKSSSGDVKKCKVAPSGSTSKKSRKKEDIKKKTRRNRSDSYNFRGDYENSSDSEGTGVYERSKSRKGEAVTGLDALDIDI